MRHDYAMNTLDVFCNLTCSLYCCCVAVVYGRQGGGLQKKKFRLIDLWECKVSDDTESIPAVINAVAGTTNSQK